MTDSMIERVARAICRANCTPDMSAEDIDCQEENAWDMWVPEARAAIEAMRTPTEAMVKEGLEEGRWEISLGVGGEHAVMFESAPRTMWEAMIDRALKP
jgi:hypothetical protein